MTKLIKPYSFLQGIESHLDRMLHKLPEDEKTAITDYVFGKVRESYHNGLHDGRSQRRPRRRMPVKII